LSGRRHRVSLREVFADVMFCTTPDVVIIKPERFENMIQQPYQAIEEIQKSLEKNIPHQLAALYLFGSIAQEKYIPGLSDINLLAVVQEGTSIHDVRAALRPIWLKYASAASAVIQQMPLIATPATLDRHLEVNPLLAAHIVKFGRLLTGRNLQLRSQPTSPAEKIGVLSRAALNASTVIAPRLLPDHKVQPNLKRLYRLANYLELDTRPQTHSPVETVAAVQAHMARLLAEQPALRWESPPSADAPPLVDALLTIYELQDRAVFLLPDWPPDRIEAYIKAVDWSAVAESLAGQYYGLQLSTPAQFRLMMYYNQSSDHYFRNYNHAWGQDPLASLTIPRRETYKELARRASHIEIKSFPHAYITTDDDEFSTLIHDFQNKLLNIQLREELMARFEKRPRVTPPIPLPDRSFPAPTRIDAIFDHLHWWTEHYTAAMHREKA